MKPLIYNDLPLDLKTIINTEYHRLDALYSTQNVWEKHNLIEKWTGQLISYGVRSSLVPASNPYESKFITEYPDITKVRYTPPPGQPSVSETSLKGVILFKSLLQLCGHPTTPIGRYDAVDVLLDKFPRDMFKQSYSPLKYINPTQQPTTTFSITLPIDLISLPDEAINPRVFMAYSSKHWHKSKMYSNQLDYGFENTLSDVYSPPKGKEFMHYFLYANVIDRLNEVSAQYPRIMHHQPKIAAKLLYHYIMRKFTAQSLTVTFNIRIPTRGPEYTVRTLLMTLLKSQITFLQTENSPLPVQEFYCYIPKEPANPIPLSSLNHVFKDLEPTYEELTT